MPEISASDLRRLKALEERLAREEDRRKALAEERKALRRAASDASRREREASKRADAVDDRLKAVLAENSELAAQLEELRGDLERLRQAGDELRAKLDETAKELERAGREREDASAKLKAAEAERSRLAERLAVAEDQLAGKEMTPVLPAKDVSQLLDALFRDLGRGLSGLDVREGEIRLNVAFGKVGRTSGFVVPSAESPPEVRENLHTVTMRFDRLVGEGGGSA